MAALNGEKGQQYVCLRRRWLLGLALLQACTGRAWSQTEEGTDELHVKAAFLFKFTGYVDWPDSAFGKPDTPFIIGVLGSPTLQGELAQLTAGRKVHERAIQIRKIQAGESAAGLHLLFVARSEALPNEAARPVLVVTEAEGSMPRGSMINFLIVDRRVRFEIALPSVEKAGLRMSSRLLAVAQRVIQTEER
ncbi:YfiR family protein [Burkholderiaceae bacterium UC74_6]